MAAELVAQNYLDCDCFFAPPPFNGVAVIGGLGFRLPVIEPFVIGFAHHTDSVSLDGIKHLIGSNRFYLPGLLGRLNEDLSMDVVVILRYELSELSEQLHNVDTLLKLLGWQMRRYEVHLELLFGKYTHMLVCLEVMRRKSRHLIEDTA